MASGGGPVKLGACYADKLDLHSGEGLLQKYYVHLRLLSPLMLQACAFLLHRAVRHRAWPPRLFRHPTGRPRTAQCAASTAPQTMTAGGGAVHITNIDCRGGEAALRSAGGAVTVDSLDGNCAIESQGGNVQARHAAPGAGLHMACRSCAAIRPVRRTHALREHVP